MKWVRNHNFRVQYELLARPHNKPPNPKTPNFSQVGSKLRVHPSRSKLTQQEKITSQYLTPGPAPWRRSSKRDTWGTCPNMTQHPENIYVPKVMMGLWLMSPSHPIPPARRSKTMTLATVMLTCMMRQQRKRSYHLNRARTANMWVPRSM